MNRRLFRKWALWLLPLLVARAFLPVGFMLAANAEGLQLAFCPDQISVSEAVTADHSAHEAPAGHDGHEPGAGHFDPPCPFAVAAVAAVIDVPHLDTDALRSVERFVPERAVAIPLPGPQRAERIRGPPFVS
jgi:hypothetical protein